MEKVMAESLATRSCGLLSRVRLSVRSILNHMAEGSDMIDTLQTIVDFFDGRKEPKDSLHVFTEKNAIGALKRLVAVTSREDDQNRRMTLVMGKGDSVSYRIIESIKNCACEVTAHVPAT